VALTFSILLVCIGCAKKPLQPVVLFYIDNATLLESQLRSVGKGIAIKHEMNQVEVARKKSEVDQIFAATLNSWLYHHGLTEGDKADFYIDYIYERARISVDGLPDDKVVHDIIDEWTKALDTAGIKYTKEIRQELKPVKNK
jgi:hypothetical protein